MSNSKRPVQLFCVACAIALPAAAGAQDDNLINASELLNLGVSNGLNVIGNVDNVLLDESGQAIEYLFFETSDTIFPTQAGKSFVAMDNVRFLPGSAGQLEAVITDTDAGRKPDELEVTRTEAEHRLLSNVLEESVQFSGGTRKIDDILIDPETGAIVYFTVEQPSSSFFDIDVRAVPADNVEIAGTGTFSSDLSLAELDNDAMYSANPEERATR